MKKLIGMIMRTIPIMNRRTERLRIAFWKMVNRPNPYQKTLKQNMAVTHADNIASRNASAGVSLQISATSGAYCTNAG